MQSNLFFGTPSTGRATVKVSPVVLFSVINHFVRRNHDQPRVIGTLLGHRIANENVIEITDSFPVPHSETDEQVAVDVEFHRQMSELHTQTNSTEKIVGWYASGDNIGEMSVLIHEFYGREASDAVHLTVDTSMRDGICGVRAYVAAPFGISSDSSRQAPVIFAPVQTDVLYHDADRVALELLNKGRDVNNGKVPMDTELESTEDSLKQLLKMVDIVLAYVRGIKSGEMPPDVEMGRFMKMALSHIPQSVHNTTALFNNNLQDVLMVVYLSLLTRAQVGVSGRLEKLAQ